MKFTANQKTLNIHLSLISRAIPSRPSHPILANVLIDATINRISLTGFDLNLGLRTAFLAEIAEGGVVSLPAKLLSDIVSRLPDGEVTIEVNDNCLAKITCSSGQYKILGMSAEDYPALPTVSDEAITLPASVLAEGLASTLFCASSDESKQQLTGVHLKSVQDILEFAATDGHRLTVFASAEPKGMPEDFALTVPSKALHELERMIQGAKPDAEITLQYDRSQLVVQCGDRTLTSRLLEGQYPDYRRLIPNRFERTATFDRRAMLAALERVAIVASQKNNVVKMEVGSGDIVISAEAQDVGAAREVVQANTSEEVLTLAFNVKYVVEALKTMSTADVLMQMNGPTSPVVFTPVGGGKMTCLVMPVQVRD